MKKAVILSLALVILLAGSALAVSVERTDSFVGDGVKTSFTLSAPYIVDGSVRVSLLLDEQEVRITGIFSVTDNVVTFNVPVGKAQKFEVSYWLPLAAENQERVDVLEVDVAKLQDAFSFRGNFQARMWTDDLEGGPMERAANLDLAASASGNKWTFDVNLKADSINAEDGILDLNSASYLLTVNADDFRLRIADGRNLGWVNAPENFIRIHETTAPTGFPTARFDQMGFGDVDLKLNIRRDDMTAWAEMDLMGYDVGAALDVKFESDATAAAWAKIGFEDLVDITAAVGMSMSLDDAYDDDNLAYMVKAEADVSDAVSVEAAYKFAGANWSPVASGLAAGTNDISARLMYEEGTISAEAGLKNNLDTGDSVIDAELEYNDGHIQGIVGFENDQGADSTVINAAVAYRTVDHADKDGGWRISGRNFSQDFVNTGVNVPILRWPLSGLLAYVTAEQELGADGPALTVGAKYEVLPAEAWVQAQVNYTVGEDNIGVDLFGRYHIGSASLHPGVQFESENTKVTASLGAYMPIGGAKLGATLASITEEGVDAELKAGMGVRVDF